MNRIRRTTLILAVLPMILVGLPRLTPAVAEGGSRAFTSGGGWIPGLVGGQATFGVFAQTQKDGTVAGHLVYIDHRANFRLISTTIVFDSTVPCESTITGTGDSTIGPVEFSVTLTDGGEPGAGNDTFSIESSVGYTNFNVLAGGNIQVHGQSCP